MVLLCENAQAGKTPPSMGFLLEHKQGIYPDIPRKICGSYFFRSPGRSPERAIVLPPALALAAATAAVALAKSLTLKFFM